MTKRKSKNALPTGVNKSLGNALTNRTEARHASVKGGPTIAVETYKDLQQAPAQASITHENAYAEFFNNAELAGREFVATKEDFKLMNTFEAINIEEVQSKSFNHLVSKYGDQLRVPRRPPKSAYTNADELEAEETRNFIDWKRDLARLAEADGVVITPFERNLELWRQLWRVLERSDLIVQIVDSRNPLIFRSADLEAYAREFEPPKRCVLLVNKSDLLSAPQLSQWQQHFEKEGINAIFWSAIAADVTSSNEEGEEEATKTPFLERAEDLIAELKRLAFDAKPSCSSVTVGMIGYPNVGKSSTINRIVGAKKTSVSATPGKTKHFQTLIFDDELTLCDCPGLVMPSFGFSASEMLLNGVLSADQMHDFFSPVQLLCTRVPRRVLEALYSIVLPTPADFEDANRSATAHELLTTLAFSRGFMSASGIPDCSRAARIVLKDVFNGRLKWAAAPPRCDQHTFDSWASIDLPSEASAPSSKQSILQTQLNKRNYLVGPNALNNQLDKEFFGKKSVGVHIRAVKGRAPVEDAKKHHKGKKEKLRRLHADQDA